MTDITKNDGQTRDSNAGRAPWPARLAAAYTRVLRYVVGAFTAVATVSVAGMMGVTTVDVLGRTVARPVPGAYDIVTVLGGLAIGCALPYTTAVKGHVAVEVLFHRLQRRGRIAVDTAHRLLGSGLFGVLAWQSLSYGAGLRASGEVTPTLQIPLYPLVYAVGASCAVVVLVILHHLIHPGRELIRP